LLPEFLIKRIPKGLRQKVDPTLHTVCESAKCPNIGECYSRGTLTFLILGNICTRGCRFCAVGKGTPKPLDPDEPKKIAEAVRKLELKYVVITSVTRDDLEDGGTGHFSETIESLRLNVAASDLQIEILIPDNLNLAELTAARPDVINHNIETVPRLYSAVRPQADYQRSLDILRRIKESGIYTKSGFMVGLGETEDEVSSALVDLARVKCDAVTIGQYLAPSKQHIQVERYVRPEEYLKYEEIGKELGIGEVAAGPFVRSSYKAEEIWKKLNDS
jgi:lipoic acid synthetase